MKKRKKEAGITSPKEQIVPGVGVEATDGYLGQVKQVIIDPETNQLRAIIVQDDAVSATVSATEQLMLPVSLIETGSKTKGGLVRLLVTRAEAQIHQQAGEIPMSINPGQAGNTNELHLPLVEERLEVGKRQINLGEVRLHKTVEQFEETTPVHLTHDDIEVQRVPVKPGEQKSMETHNEGEWLVIPVLREVAVVKKEVVVIEEIRIRKRQITEEQEVTEQLRREHIEIEKDLPVQ